MKKIFLLKFVAAIIVAFVVLNFLSMFYYNIPVQKISKTHSTDYVWEKGKFYSRGTEGFASGTTDENGFNNLKALKKGEIDVLIMGSSHMEALNVAQNKNTTAVLNELLKASGSHLDAYNIGLSGHNLVTCLNNFSNAIEEFGAKKYVIIETQSVTPDAQELEKVLDGTLSPVSEQNEGVIGQLQKVPYLRLMYFQLMNAIGDKAENNASEEQNKDDKTFTAEERNKMIDVLLGRCSQICENAGIEFVIFYNCEIKIDDQGKVLDQNDVEDVKQFKDICEKNNITFINMYDSFKENYYKTNKLPRGFSNTSVGSGHLNEEGHRVIAEKLFSVISQ